MRGLVLVTDEVKRCRNAFRASADVRWRRARLLAIRGVIEPRTGSITDNRYRTLIAVALEPASMPSEEPAPSPLSCLFTVVGPTAAFDPLLPVVR